MKTKIYIIALLFFTVLQASAQSDTKKQLYSKDFKWTIDVPEGFDNMSAEEKDRLQKKGAKAIEEAYNEKVVNEAKSVFVIKSGKMNFLDVNQQPFDVAKDGSFKKSCESSRDVLWESLHDQMPDLTLDTASSVEKIDGLDFQKISLSAEYQGKIILRGFVYMRLFGKKELSISILYTEEDKGQQMMDALRHSKFDK